MRIDMLLEQIAAIWHRHDYPRDYRLAGNEQRRTETRRPPGLAEPLQSIFLPPHIEYSGSYGCASTVALRSEFAPADNSAAHRGPLTDLIIT